MKRTLLAGAVLVSLLCYDLPGAGQTIPEEAQRHFSRGIAAAEGAKSAADYADAVREFEAAKRLAPNWPDVHYNLRLLYEQVGQDDDAIRSLHMDPRCLDRECEALYPAKDYHTLYFGEIVACYQTE